MYKMRNIKFSELSNGIKVYTLQREGKLFSLNLGLNIGAMAESQDEKGICHFIEHMVFKGTKFDDNESLNYKIENLGGDFNAYTDFFKTVFTVSALKEELESSLIILRDMLMYPNFKKEDLEKEKTVILSELRASLDDQEEMTHKHLFLKAYDKSPLKFDVIGSEESISNFTIDQISSFYQKTYGPEQTVLVVVSPYSHDEVVSLMNNLFSAWSKNHYKISALEFEKNIPGTHESYKDMEQSSLGILYTFPMEEKDKLPIRVLNYKLGVSGNAILFRELREKRGLVYDVYSDVDLTNNVQQLLIYTQVSDENLDFVEEQILSILEDIKLGIYFKDHDLALMKKVMKTSVYDTLENIHDLSSTILEEIFNHEEPLSLLKDIEDLDKLTLNDLHQMSQRIFQNPTIYKRRGEFDEEDNGDSRE